MPAAQWILLAVVSGLAACTSATVSRPPSPASICAEAAMQHLPRGLDPEESRCVATGLVKAQCGDFDPTMAVQSSGPGQQCARRGATPGELRDCCQAALGRRLE